VAEAGNRVEQPRSWTPSRTPDISSHRAEVLRCGAVRRTRNPAEGASTVAPVPRTSTARVLRSGCHARFTSAFPRLESRQCSPARRETADGCTNQWICLNSVPTLRHIFVDCADAAQADCLVTCDERHFPSSGRTPRSLSPRNFYFFGLRVDRERQSSGKDRGSGKPSLSARTNPQDYSVP
jgi:hypothetical protein